MTQPELIAAIEGACVKAPAFLDTTFTELEDGLYTFADGCPFPGTADMFKYKFEFTKAQYNRELKINMYEASLDS